MIARKMCIDERARGRLTLKLRATRVKKALRARDALCLCAIFPRGVCTNEESYGFIVKDTGWGFRKRGGDLDSLFLFSFTSRNPSFFLSRTLRNLV